jgi:phosphoribosyl 1,2-cyclic phosphodiesterase
VLWTEKAAVLIDCGCSAKYIVENLSSLGIEPCNLTAAVITHAHIDHISPSGLNFLLENNIPIRLHADTLEDIFQKYGNKVDDCHTVSFNDSFKIKDIIVEPFNVYHKDSKISRTLGFSFSSLVQGRKYKIGYMTDTGKVCKNIIKSLGNSNILIIESNYDTEMLDSSFRPYENKRWILSDWGHLANEDAAWAIVEIKMASTAADSLKYVFLAHLSYHHNDPNLALQVSKEILYSQNINNINLFAAKRKERCSAIKIK